MNRKVAKAQQAEPVVVEDAQPVIVTEVVPPEDAQPEQAMLGPTRRSSAARFMADLLKPVATRIGAQAPKAHLWELIKFLNAVDHGNVAAARALADSMLEMTLAMIAPVSARSSIPVEAETPAATPQQPRTSAARFAADLLKPIANRIAARIPKAIAWELIKFYNAVDHRNPEFATERAQALYSQTIIMVDQLANQSTEGYRPAAASVATSDDAAQTDDLLPDF